MVVIKLWRFITNQDKLLTKIDTLIIFVDTTHNRHRCQLEIDDNDADGGNGNDDDNLLDYVIESVFFLYPIFSDH